MVRDDMSQEAVVGMVLERPPLKDLGMQEGWTKSSNSEQHPARRAGHAALRCHRSAMGSLCGAAAGRACSRGGRHMPLLTASVAEWGPE